MNIEDSNSKMTVFYSKKTGLIKAVISGKQDMSFFGENEVDYIEIYDKIIVEKDSYVINNSYLFIIENNLLKLKEGIDLSKYS